MDLEERLQTPQTDNREGSVLRQKKQHLQIHGGVTAGCSARTARRAAREQGGACGRTAWEARRGRTGKGLVRQARGVRLTLEELGGCGLLSRGRGLSMSLGRIPDGGWGHAAWGRGTCRDAAV